jgi:hypothetical protein
MRSLHSMSKNRAEFDGPMESADFEAIERQFHTARIAYRLALRERRQAAAVADPFLLIGRRRHREFARTLVQELLANVPLATASDRAVCRVFRQLRSTSAIRRKASTLMQHDDICAVLARLMANGGLTPPRAMADHIELIKSGNVNALKAYYALTLGVSA